MIHHYKQNGFNIVLDINSGSIHMVDDMAYDAIVMYEKQSKDEIEGYLIAKYEKSTSQDALSLIAKIEELKESGKLFSKDNFVAKADKLKGLPLKALCLNVTHACNMSCAYCFANSAVSSSNNNNVKTTCTGEFMTVETGKRAVEFLIENSGDQKYLDIDFFGGEPLLNWGVVKEVVEYARKRELQSGKEFRFTLTTNGLNIDEDVIDFSNREMHNVVLSLDGRQKTHDNMRKLSDGRGSYEEVLPKIKALVRARYDKGYYIRGTYTNENLDFMHDILHLADLGFKELSLEPVVGKSEESYSLTHKDLPKLMEQYELLAVEMLNRREQNQGFGFYHYTLDLTGGPCLHKRIAGCGVGLEYLAVTPDGQMYPCHQFIGNEKFLMGDVFGGVTNENLCSEFADCDIYSREECVECWARFYCSGGCAANAFNATGSIQGVNEFECELFKKRIECAIMLKIAEVTDC